VESAPTPHSFHTKIAGVTHRNEDHSRRQEIIRKCNVGERLKLERDPDNQFDCGAIKVLRLNGEQLGYIPEHVSRGRDPSGLSDRMDDGEEYQCRISDITGGGPGLSYGVNLEIGNGDFESDIWPHSNSSSYSPQPYPGWNSAGIWLAFLAAIILAAAFAIATIR
jgi:hypothetical protein